MHHTLFLCKCGSFTIIGLSNSVANNVKNDIKQHNSQSQVLPQDLSNTDLFEDDDSFVTIIENINDNEDFNSKDFSTHCKSIKKVNYPKISYNAFFSQTNKQTN